MTPATVMKKCNTDDKESTLTFREMMKCMKKNNVTKQDRKEAGNILLKYAYINTTRIPYIAEGVEKATHGRVSESAALAGINACNTNNDTKLVWNETKACLLKHKDALGIGNQNTWNEIKWYLSRSAEIDLKGLKKAEDAAKEE